MSAMETTFTVRTDTDNDAMQVPDGIETVVVNDSAERVIVPPGVQIIRLQTAQGGGGGGQVRSQSPDGGEKYGDMIDEFLRAKRSVATDTAPLASRPPAVTEKSLSLPSCPPTPPGSRSAGTDAPDFHPAARRPPAPLAVAEPVAEPFTAPPATEPRTPPAAKPDAVPLAEPEPSPSAPVEEEEAPPRDIFDDRTLEVDRKRVINQQPTATAPAAVGNGRLVRYAGDTESEMKDPLVKHGSTKMRKLDSFGWREEFERGEKESKPTLQKFGRVLADILCCGLGV